MSCLGRACPSVCVDGMEESHVVPALRVLGLAGSPRKRGNTRLLLERALQGAESQHAVTELIDLCALDVSPCVACDGCFTHDRCVVDDDFQRVFDRLVLADRIVLAAPIYFMGLPAQAKSFIDRGQCLWARKFVRKLPLPPSHSGIKRRGHLISVGGSDLKDLFACAERTFKFFLHTLNAEMGPSLLYSGVDHRGAILRHATALDDALAFGARLAFADDDPAK